MSDFTYSGPSVGAAFVAGVFNLAWELANQRALEAKELAGDAVDRATNPERLPTAPTIYSPIIPTAPVLDSPMTSSEAAALFKENADKVTADLTTGFSQFLSDYFGELPEFAAAQAWLLKALTTGGTGMSATAENQIFERERSRILNDAARAEEELVSTWAARRYPTPPGALRAQMARLGKESNDKLAAAARDVAVQQAGYEIENTRFAVTAAINLRTGAIAAAGEYMRALALGPQLGVTLTTSLVDAQAKIASTLTSFYQAQVTAAEIPLRVSTTNAEMVMRTNEANQKAGIEAMNQRVSATMAAAQSLGVQAAAALNSLHAQTGISANESL
jgi:hypothetical protein